jgi:hypothetical protein
VQLRVRIRSIMVVLGWVIVTLVALHALAWTLVFTRGLSQDLVWFKLVDLDCERNAPTLFSSLELLLCSAFLTVIARAHKGPGRQSVPWYGLAAVFAFLALDETAQFHEAMAKPWRDLLHTSGVLYQAWVLPYAAGLLGLGLLYIPWYLRLPARSRRLFALAAVIYLAGALVFEMAGGLRRPSRPDDPLLPMFVMEAFEEGLEMVGALVFIGSLLDYIQRHLGGLRLELPGGGEPAPAPNEDARG